MITHRPLPGIVQIDAASDRKFRDFLINACASNARPLMKKALDETPRSHGRARSVRFFGAIELNEMLRRANEVVRECDQFCPGISDWLQATGYGNEPAMIKAFAAWAEQPVDLREIVPAGGKVN